jgi:hypothetical protein
MANRTVMPKERKTMQRNQIQYSGYILAAGLGAVGGGLILVVATKAVPKMISQMMAGMMAQMAAGDCNPADI